MARKSATQTTQQTNDPLKSLMAQFPDVGLAIASDSAKTQLESNVFPTGSYLIDRSVIKFGGIPRGRITEIFGNFSGGKTTLSLHVAANAQKQGYNVLYVDLEHALDFSYVANLGVDPDKLIVAKPQFGEDAFNLIKTMIDQAPTYNLGLVVLDSLAAIQTHKEGDSNIGEANMGLNARLIGGANRQLVPLCAKNNVALILLNQVRDNINKMGMGSPETTPGGRSTSFAATLRLKMTNHSKKEDVNGDPSGHLISVHCVKNKLAPPQSKLDVQLLYGIGIDKRYDILEYLLREGLIVKSGSWYKTKDGQTLGTLSTAYDKNKELLTQMADNHIPNNTKDIEVEQDGELEDV